MYYNCIISPGYHASLWKSFIMSKPWSSLQTSLIVSLWLKINITLEESFHKCYQDITAKFWHSIFPFLTRINRHILQRISILWYAWIVYFDTAFSTKFWLLKVWNVTSFVSKIQEVANAYLPSQFFLPPR